MLTNSERIVTELESAGRERVRGFAFVLGATFLPAYTENESVGLRRGSASCGGFELPDLARLVVFNEPHKLVPFSM